MFVLCVVCRNVCVDDVAYYSDNWLNFLKKQLTYNYF